MDINTFAAFLLIFFLIYTHVNWAGTRRPKPIKHFLSTKNDRHRMVQEINEPNRFFNPPQSSTFILKKEKKGTSIQLLGRLCIGAISAIKMIIKI
jgi:hypothetical protein